MGAIKKRPCIITLFFFFQTTQTQNLAARATQDTFEQGTYAFRPLTTADPKCTESVEYWESAFKNFAGLPPSKSQGGTLYSVRENVSFLTLYNAQTDATVDCRVVTCTQTTQTTASGDSAEHSDPPAEERHGYALLCKTIPAALPDDDSAPLT